MEAARSTETLVHIYGITNYRIQKECSCAVKICLTTRGDVKYTGENCILRNLMMYILYLIFFFWGGVGWEGKLNKEVYGRRNY